MAKNNSFIDKLFQSEGYSQFYRKLMIYSLIAVAAGMALWIMNGQFGNPANICGFGCLAILFFLKSYEKPLWPHRLLWWGITILVMAALFMGSHWPGGRDMACVGSAAVLVAAVIGFVKKNNQ